jgi:hypothetical protein
MISDGARAERRGTSAVPAVGSKAGDVKGGAGAAERAEPPRRRTRRVVQPLLTYLTRTAVFGALRRKHAPCLFG